MHFLFHGGKSGFRAQGSIFLGIRASYTFPASSCTSCTSTTQHTFSLLHNFDLIHAETDPALCGAKNKPSVAVPPRPHCDVILDEIHADDPVHRAQPVDASELQSMDRVKHLRMIITKYGW